MSKKKTTIKNRSVGGFIEDTKAELKKVTWPTKNIVTNASVTIVVILIILTLYIAGVDFIFGKLALMLNILV